MIVNVTINIAATDAERGHRLLLTFVPSPTSTITPDTRGMIHTTRSPWNCTTAKYVRLVHFHTCIEDIVVPFFNSFLTMNESNYLPLIPVCQVGDLCLSLCCSTNPGITDFLSQCDVMWCALNWIQITWQEEFPVRDILDTDSGCRIIPDM